MSASINKPPPTPAAAVKPEVKKLAAIRIMAETYEMPSGNKASVFSKD